MDLMHDQNEPTSTYNDNKYAIVLLKNHVFHKRRKHIDIRYHIIQELVNNGVLGLRCLNLRVQTCLFYLFYCTQFRSPKIKELVS